MRLIPQRRAGGAGAGRGFTLLEVVLVLALIGLLTALVAGASVALLREKPVTGEEILRSVILKMRRDAVVHMKEVRLSYDAKGRCFVRSSVSGEDRIPVETKGEFKVEFLNSMKGGAVLLGGDVVETDVLPFVTFFPDGSCSPFRAQIRTGRAARQMNIDPWTCAEVLDTKERR